MIGVALLRILTASVSVGLAAGLLARDHGLRANRLLAAFLLFNGWWAVGELQLLLVEDPLVIEGVYRAMCLGWMPLGVLCAHVSVTLSAMEQHPIARRIPWFYAGIVAMVPVTVGTDWVIAGAESTRFGWRPIFGPGLIVAYGLMAAPVFAVLRSWRGLLGMADDAGQLLLARIVFFGVSGALALGTLTSVVLPVLELESVRITTTLLAGVGLAVAFTLRRFGHSLISPEAFAREILDTLEDGVVLVSDDGRLRDANRAFLRMVGETEAGAIGRPVEDWIRGAQDPESGGDLSGSTLGQLVPRAGAAIPVVLEASVPCRGAGGRVGHAIVVRDRREIAALQQQLVVSARLAAVGDLAQPISKAINEPVARVREELEGLSLDWATAADGLELAGLDDPCREAIEEGHELIDECVEGVDRITTIVREVAGFSGDGSPEDFVSHRLDRIVERALRVAGVHAPPDVEIEARLDPDVRIRCHFAEIERVVTNLLVNAIHALDGKPRGRRHLVVAVAAQGDRALLHVEDDGCGIDPDVLDRIFDPFFTTKPVGKGTGLGLAISYHIVKAHDGEIRVSSEPERGTSVAVLLPRAPGSADESAG